MTRWTDTIEDWWTDTSEDWWTGEGAVVYVYSVSRYYLIAESVDYYYTTIPQDYYYIAENAAYHFEAGS